MSLVRQNFSSGSASEPALGFSRAVRVGSQVVVAGTTASSATGPVGGDDAAAQAREILSRIHRALGMAGAGLKDVVRTRIFLTEISDFDVVAAVHRETFAEILPVTSVFGISALASAGLRVEIEVDAIVTE